MAKSEKIFKADQKFLIALAKTIKELRAKNNLTQEQYADLSDIHWRTVQRVETELRNISIGLFLCLAKGINLSPIQLMQKVIDNYK